VNMAQRRYGFSKRPNRWQRRGKSAGGIGLPREESRLSIQRSEVKNHPPTLGDRRGPNGRNGNDSTRRGKKARGGHVHRRSGTPRHLEQRIAPGGSSPRRNDSLLRAIGPRPVIGNRATRKELEAPRLRMSRIRRKGVPGLLRAGEGGLALDVGGKRPSMTKTSKTSGLPPANLARHVLRGGNNRRVGKGRKS